MWTRDTKLNKPHMVFFKHMYITMPGITIAGEIVSAASNLTTMLQDNTKENICPTTMQQLRPFADIFQQATKNNRATKRKAVTCATIPESVTDVRGKDCSHPLRHQKTIPNLITMLIMELPKKISCVITQEENDNTYCLNALS